MPKIEACPIFYSTINKIRVLLSLLTEQQNMMDSSMMMTLKLIIIVDSLTRRVEIGHTYWITGMVVIDWSERVSSPFLTSTLEVNHS